jgi:hypothetical protein
MATEQSGPQKHRFGPQKLTYRVPKINEFIFKKIIYFIISISNFDRGTGIKTIGKSKKNEFAESERVFIFHF